MLIAVYTFLFSWDTLSWNKRIMDQIELTETQMEQDESKFHKKLLDDQTQLEDKLDTLQVRFTYFYQPAHSKQCLLGTICTVLHCMCCALRVYTLTVFTMMLCR